MPETIPSPAAAGRTLENALLTGGDSDNRFTVGGVGVDKLTGGAEDDLLVDGTTVHDTNALALAAILAEWNSGSSYGDRVAHLTGTAGGFGGGS